MVLMEQPMTRLTDRIELPDLRHRISRHMAWRHCVGGRMNIVTIKAM